MRPAICMTLFFVFFGSVLTAQNAFLDLFHPFHKSLITLRTDSLFIRTQDQTSGIVERSIGYRYPKEDGIIPEWLEIRKEVKNQRIWRIAQRSLLQGAFNVVETETLDSSTLKTAKERAFISKNSAGTVDSVWYEIWNDPEWEPVQKTTFVYVNNSLLQRTEQRWNAAAGIWLNEWNYQAIYNNNKLAERRYETWKDSSWVLQNHYAYNYRQGETQPAYTVWNSNIDDNLTPVDSLVTWYDSEEFRDSSLTFFWNNTSNTWYKASREVLKDDDQQITGQGENFYPDGQDKWREKEENIYIPGDLTFTNEPKEELVRVFDPVSGEWKDKRRKTVIYQPLDSTHIYGLMQVSELSDSLQEWEEVFFAEAWFSIQQNEPTLDTLQERNRRFTFSYACGLPNPYIRNMTLTFPESDAGGNYELTIINEDGRLIYHQKYDDSGIGFVDAPLQPGFYMVSVSRGNTPLCTQKLIVHQ